MKFFKPEDFAHIMGGTPEEGPMYPNEAYIAHTANAKLEANCLPVTDRYLLHEVLRYLEQYDKSAFDNNTEMANYIRVSAGIPKPEPKTPYTPSPEEGQEAYNLLADIYSEYNIAELMGRDPNYKSILDKAFVLLTIPEKESK